MLSPVDSLDSFKSFASWMVISTDRARSFTTTMRAAAGYLKATSRPSYTTDPTVKMLVKELEDIHGTESQPMTHGTRRMLVAALGTVIPRMRSKAPLLSVRDRVNTINESVGCLRVGESLGAVEFHGLSANDCFILKDLSSGEITVELKVHDSKTKLDRWVNMAGETAVSKVPVAKTYAELFRLHGLTTVKGVEGGFEFIQPDSWAVKLSLLAPPEDYEQRLKRVLEGYARVDPESQPLVARMLKYARDAVGAGSKGEGHKYVLLNEGPRASPKHAKLMEALARVGFGAVGEDINLVPAPLLRSTTAAGARLTPMPMQPDSASKAVKEVFEEAFKMANPPGDPDPELDLQGHEAARWNNHSWRRMGDKVARDSKHIHQMSAVEVDLYAGWNLKEHDLDMQLHYAGQQRAHRVKRAAITAQI